ncbi:MAG: gliding motility-associated C-terminal domain-containing protein [Bacteroidetes bacterium]|nr:MAG: gliding motility-associated C-terminal domain-containing protein [Bacteroidota bacterium]
MNNQLENLAAGAYVLTASRDACRDTLRFSIGRELCPLYFPNAFSPNRDGVNDAFGPQGVATLNAEVLRFEIFDRWGGQVYRQGPLPLMDPALPWDGRSQGQDLPAGIYVYFAEVRYEDGQSATFAGEVLLLR